MRKKNYLKWNNSKRVFDTIQWRQDLQISKSIDCVQISAKKYLHVFCKISSARWTRQRKHKSQIMIRKNPATFLPSCPIKVFHKAKMNGWPVWPIFILQQTASKWPTSLLFYKNKFWAIKSDFEYGYLLGWFDMADFILILLTWNRRSSCWPPSVSSRSHFHPSRLGSRVWKIVHSIIYSSNITSCLEKLKKRAKEGSGDFFEL